MSIYFNEATTDKLASALTTNYTQVTYSIWTMRFGDGGGAGGRLFDKREGSDAQVVLIYNPNPNPNNAYNFDVVWSGGTASWRFPRPAGGVWAHILVTYDGGSSANDPLAYVDGVSQTVTEATGPSGTLNTNTSRYIVGNRANDDARNWNGRLCEFAIWNRILTTAEISALAKGYSASFFPNGLQEYIPLIREPVSYRQAAPTLTGGSVQNHPKIIYPF